MSNIKVPYLSETVKGIAQVITGALLLWIGQQWFIGDLEFKRVEKDSYLSAPLGQQGLTMAFDGKPLKNVSIVEFGIFNRTQKQFSDVDFVFTIDEIKTAPKLVSGGILVPEKFPQSQIVEEIKTDDLSLKKFRLKVVPRQKDAEFFHAVFVFEGEKAPKMSVITLTKEAPLVAYQDWRDITKAFAIVFAGVFLMMALISFFVSLIEFFVDPRKHKANVEKFVHDSANLVSKGDIKDVSNECLAKAGEMYAAFTKPKSSKLWSKIFGERKYEY